MTKPLVEPRKKPATTNLIDNLPTRPDLPIMTTKVPTETSVPGTRREKHSWYTPAHEGRHEWAETVDEAVVHSERKYPRWEPPGETPGPTMKS